LRIRETQSIITEKGKKKVAILSKTCENVEICGAHPTS
jgi:hypothetical protein